MIARNTITIIMIQAAMTLITNTSIPDTGSPAGAVEAPPSCRLASAIGESAGGETTSESGAAVEVCVVAGWVVGGWVVEVPVAEVFVVEVWILEGCAPEVPALEVSVVEVPVAEGWGPIKKMGVDDEDWESEAVELKEDRLLSVPETAGAAVEAAEAVEAEVFGAQDADKLSSLVAIQLAADPCNSPFT
ncbi:MAG: hypothetical protein ABSA18_10725 [Dehalococcoidia bacterium]|jgi:hypothetical protein